MEEKNIPKLFDQPITSRNLSKLLFKAELPEKVIRSIPAQTLYLAIRRNGLPDSVDVINIATREQLQIMLDLDCWKKDSFDEERFWEWLELPDMDNDLDILKKILRSFDMKLTGMIISKYVDICVFDDQTESPPSADYYTPDQGFTWLHVKLSEPHRNFLLTRFIASIFESSAETFYQLINVPGIATLTQLEEESFQEKQKRLLAEGLPDLETAWKLNNPVSHLDLPLKANPIPRFSETISIAEPLIYDIPNSTHLSNLLQNYPRTDDLMAELTLLLNAAAIRWNVEPYEIEQIDVLSAQIKGAIEIGFQAAIQEYQSDTVQIYEKVYLQGVYRYGLGIILSLKDRAKKINPEVLKDLAIKNQQAFAALAGLSEELPKLLDEFKIHEGQSYSTYRAFCSLDQINGANQLLAALETN